MFQPFGNRDPFSSLTTGARKQRHHFPHGKGVTKLLFSLFWQRNANRKATGGTASRGIIFRTRQCVEQPTVLALLVPSLYLVMDMCFTSCASFIRFCRPVSYCRELAFSFSPSLTRSFEHFTLSTNLSHSFHRACSLSCDWSQTR